MSEETNVQATTTEVTTNIDTLTVAQLEAMTKEDLQKAKTNFNNLVDAKIAEFKKVELAEFKAKLAGMFDNFKTVVLPVVRYAAGAAILLKVFNLI
jgi:hypothetical protein